MARRLFPHPLLSLLIVFVWLALVNRVSLGGVVFGAILGFAVPLYTAAWWPGRQKIHLVRAAGYAMIVMLDIVRANFTVARIVLFMPVSALRPAWITVPIELRTPEAITVLAGTITMTPGTVTSDIAEDGASILVHCLHAPEPEAVVAEIKDRYERRLKEIFE